MKVPNHLLLHFETQQIIIFKNKFYDKRHIEEGKSMFRAYAHFAVNHPIIHYANMLVVLAVFVVSCYQLLANENLLFVLGLLFVVLPTIVFARSSDYKRKYLNSNN